MGYTTSKKNNSRSEAIEPEANRRLLPPAPLPRRGVWGEGNVGRRSPFARTKKPALEEAGSCGFVTNYLTFIEDFQKVLDFIEWYLHIR